ncbi:hypothetical protein GSI_08022 [Ganoderma sinense ZZ0214-1]|uniref:Uncharacterized protein n=1 Tax=Ganoderma sinense ZZ0214-1 TaxID=1077348 RepID=A0A2G8S7R4_9APHY|nr:hypothetical protein GSI_08022 [Ganoderma sinense ZZ0214-1]
MAEERRRRGGESISSQLCVPLSRIYAPDKRLRTFKLTPPLTWRSDSPRPLINSHSRSGPSPVHPPQQHPPTPRTARSKPCPATHRQREHPGPGPSTMQSPASVPKRI